MKLVAISRRPDCSISTNASGECLEPLDLDGLPLAPPDVAETLDRLRRSQAMTLPDYARWLKQFRWTDEQLEAIPLHIGVPRFTLDD